MKRALPLSLILLLAAGCSSTAPVVSAPAIAGGWRSVTPSLEFVRVSILANANDPGALSARIAFSGTAWEGTGRVAGDSLVAGLAIIGSTQPTATFVARERADTLRVLMQATGANPIELTLVRMIEAL